MERVRLLLCLKLLLNFVMWNNMGSLKILRNLSIRDIYRVKYLKKISGWD